MLKKVLSTAAMLLVLMGSARAEERTTSDPPAHLGVVMYLVGKRHCDFNLDRHADLWAFNESPRYPIMRTVDLVIDAELMRAVEGTDKFCIRIETEFPTLRTPGHPRGGGRRMELGVGSSQLAVEAITYLVGKRRCTLGDKDSNLAIDAWARKVLMRNMVVDTVDTTVDVLQMLDEVKPSKFCADLEKMMPAIRKKAGTE